MIEMTPLRYQKGHRPRCAECGQELNPAPVYKSDQQEWAYCGFLPCVEHPRAEVIYPEITA